MQYNVCFLFCFFWAGGGGEPGALQDLISDFNIYFERHHMMIKGWRGAVVSLVRYNLNCYRSQGEGILKGGKNRKDELVTYIYCGLFNVQNLNDGSYYKTGSSGQTQALGR